jgi:hypothetical protein
MNRWLGSIARIAGGWRDRYRPVIVALLLGSGLSDDSKQDGPKGRGQRRNENAKRNTEGSKQS